jgi:hypothetical protein
MAFSIEQFKSALALGGARPSLFEVQISFNPGNGTITNGLTKVPVMVKAASIPASTVQSIPVPYFGRQIKFGGDRTFDDWQVQVINDEDFAVRAAFEEWSKLINSHEGNISALRPGLGTAGSLNTGYKANAVVKQFSKLGGSPIATYQFIGIYPTVIGDIQLSWEAENQIEEFAVVFSYDYWEKVTVV